MRKPLVPPTDVQRISVPRDYKTVQEAGDAVASGGTIELADGTYPGGITIWKPLTIQGCDRQSTVLDEGDISILPEAKDVCLQDLTLQGCARFPDFEHQGFIHVGGDVRLNPVRVADGEVHINGGYASLESCEIDGGRTGVNAWWGEAYLRNCTVSGNCREGIFLGRDSWWYQPGPMCLTLEACSIVENGDGIRARRSFGELVVRGTSFSRNTDRGASLDLLEVAVFEECEISGNGRAGFEMAGGRPLMRQCKVSRNKEAGIYLRDADAEVLRCEIVQNGRSGLVINTGGQASVHTCKVARNGENGVVAASPMVYERDSAACMTRSAPQVALSSCELLLNERHGIFVSGNAQATLNDCEVADNGADGLQVKGRAALWLGSCRFLRNRAYGLRAVVAPDVVERSAVDSVSAIVSTPPAVQVTCNDEGSAALYSMPLVSGTGNYVPCPDDEDSNEQGALHPDYPGLPWPAGLAWNLHAQG